MLFLLNFLLFLFFPAVVIVCKKNKQLKPKKPEEQPNPAILVERPPDVEEPKKEVEIIRRKKSSSTETEPIKRSRLSAEDIEKRVAKKKRRRLWGEKIKMDRMDRTGDRVVAQMMRKAEMEEFKRQLKKSDTLTPQIDNRRFQLQPWMDEIPAPYTTNFKPLRNTSEYWAMAKPQREAFTQELDKEIMQRIRYVQSLIGAHFKWLVACHREYIQKTRKQTSHEEQVPWMENNPIYSKFLHWLEIVYQQSVDHNSALKHDLLYCGLIQDVRKALVFYEKYVSPTMRSRLPRIWDEIERYETEDCTQPTVSELYSETTQSSQDEDYERKLKLKMKKKEGSSDSADG